MEAAGWNSAKVRTTEESTASDATAQRKSAVVAEVQC
jgi:hypothetical protein